MKIGRTLLAVLVAGLLASTAAPAQDPDCTGISAVFNTDPNLVGELTTVSVASGLARPLFVTSPPGDTSRLFIVDQDGLIQIVKNNVLLATEFLDVSALTQSPADGCGANCEQGLLGLAFDPGYATNRYFYIYHTNSTGSAEVLARYERNAGNQDDADESTRTVILTLPTLFSNHNGGSIAFSPLDGRLYLATGDGGGSCDSGNNGQDLTERLGKMLRLDVSTLPYGTSGNPFDGHATNAEEIWSWGLRNPYRWSFDRITGAIYIGDVGQGVWEEIDCEPAGTGSKNYGWVFHEGDHCPNPSCGGSIIDCNPPGYTPPIEEYNQGGSFCAVTGGAVYRGCRMPDLHGTYFYADFCANNIESFRTDATCSNTTPLTRTAELNDASQAIGSIAGFGEDARGEMYILDRGGGTNGQLFKILPILSIVELSGANAEMFMLGKTLWTWEDLKTSGQAVTFYKVLRSSVPQGPFSCIKRQSTNSWTGDVATPPSGQSFYYLVNAQGPSGGAPSVETTLGFWSDGTPRTQTATLCF